MKKTNWFMTAYIIFLFICIFVQCFVQFPLWTSLVIAVTVSSWIFAIADIALYYSELSSENCDRFDKLCMRFKHSIEDELSEIEDYELSSNQSGAIVNNSQENLDKVKGAALDLKKTITDMEHDISANRGKIRIAEKIGAVLYVLGFLTFLCVVVFDPLSTRFGRLQDTLTVSAFALILSTQLSREKVVQYLKEITTKMEKRLDEYNKASRTVQKYCWIMKNRMNGEAATHAD